MIDVDATNPIKPRISTGEREELIAQVRVLVRMGVAAKRACSNVGLNYQTFLYHTTRKGLSLKRKRETPPQQSPSTSSTTEAVSNGLTDSIVHEPASPTN